METSSIYCLFIIAWHFKEDQDSLVIKGIADFCDIVTL